MKEDQDKNDEEFGKRCCNELNVRVAFFLPSLAGGGAERVVLELVRGFVKYGISVDLLVTRSGGAYWKSVPQDIRLINFDSWMTLTCLPGLVRYIRRERPDVLLASQDAAQATALMGQMFFLEDTHLIIRQADSFLTSYASGGFKKRMCIRIVRRLAHRADAVIAVSSGVADEFRLKIPRIASVVQALPNPVVTRELLESVELPVKHPWFDDSHIPVIVAAGRLTPQKDYPTLLKAFSEVADSRPVRLVILGEGPMQSRLIMTTRKLGVAQKVDFVGFQDNPFAWIAKARALVLSSRYEGLPGVLIQAMACGTPVVSTDCPHGPREILEDGRLGPLVPVGDHSALAQGIMAVLDNPLNPEVLCASSRRYLATTSIKQYVKLVMSMISARKRKSDV